MPDPRPRAKPAAPKKARPAPSRKPPSPGAAAAGQQPPAGPSSGPFPVVETENRMGDVLNRRKSQGKLGSMAIAAGVFVVVVVAGLLVFFFLKPWGKEMAIAPIPDQTVDELVPLQLSVSVQEAEQYKDRLRFSLHEPPEGAKIDEATGELQWVPSEEQGPGNYTLEVRAAVEEEPEIALQRQFSVCVREVDQPPEVTQPADRTVSAGEPVAFVVAARDRDVPSQPLRFALGRDAPPGARISSASGDFRWLPGRDAAGRTHEITVRVARAGGGEVAEQTFAITVKLPEEAPGIVQDQSRSGPFEPDGTALPPGLTSGESADTDLAAGGAQQSTSGFPPGAASAGDADETAALEASFQQELVKLYDEGRLLLKDEYPALRKIFADRFARQHRLEIDEALGGEESELRRWLAEHAEIREELLLAIDPAHDDVTACLRLFREVFEAFPDQIEPYANLAIAVAVVWDQPRRAVHRSPTGQHKSIVPEGQMEALDNFRFYCQSEDAMRGRTRYLPWEFLVHVVNHGTTLGERQWALANYVNRRVGFGKCYHDVPYDHPMLAGMAPQIAGQPHTLENARKYGGVCSCQADFAARIGKSIGVPAFYASAENRYGERHAWVMWAELGSVTANGFTFSLESYGRYRGDKYYVGNLTDPHTATPTTDREVELRLHTVGMDPVAKRHAALVMQVYPMLLTKAEMELTDQLTFLNKLIEYCPGNEEAWIALAKMSRDGQITKVNSKPMNLALEKLFDTFARLPDFTWVVFDDMVSFQDIPKKRTALYGRLAGMYEQAGRPDLSCEARLKYCDYLVDDKEHTQALNTLAEAVLLFPDEGRYVPKILDRMETLVPEVKNGPQRMIQFYQALLPRVPKKRGDRPSEYCKQMYDRAIERFEQAGQTQLAQVWRMERAKLELAGGR